MQRKRVAHVLAGIVSRRLGESCSEENYALYTSISQFLPWIESSIKENGGMASCGFNISATPKLGVSQEPPSPPGLLVLGGQTKEGPSSSVETFGFENCTIPPLPESRYGFGSFLTPTEPPQLAVCGGWWRENQVPQIVSHSMLSLVSGIEARSLMGSLKMVFKAWST